MKTVLIYYYCNTWKEYSSMNIRSSTAYSNTVAGRKKLWSKIREDLDNKDIEIEEGYNYTKSSLREAVILGNISEVNE